MHTHKRARAHAHAHAHTQIPAVHLQQINALIHMLHLRRQPLHKRVVKRRSHIALPECSGTISKNRVGVGADEAVVDACGES